MSYFLRVIQNPEEWSQLSESPLWGQDDCPPELLKQMIDSRGISVYEVSTPEEINRVTTAITISWGTFRPCSFALIPKDSLKKLKIKTSTTTGNTFDKQTNSLHRDVVEISGKQLIQFVKIVKDEADIKTITKEDIVKNLKNGIANGIFERNQIFKKEPALGILKQFWDTSFVEIAIT